LVLGFVLLDRDAGPQPIACKRLRGRQRISGGQPLKMDGVVTG
jgi:hypothetical protein